MNNFFYDLLMSGKATDTDIKLTAEEKATLKSVEDTWFSEDYLEKVDCFEEDSK